MLYAILIYAPEDVVEAFSPEEDDEHVQRHLKIHDRLRAENKLGPTVRLMPTRTAKQLRTVGTPTVVDGPFAETKEQLLGLYVVDCVSQEEAMDIARSLPTVGSIFEVRPVRRFFPGNALPPEENPVRR